MNQKHYFLLCLIAGSMVLTGCIANKAVVVPESKLLNQAKTALAANKYETAMQSLDKLDSEYPLSKCAEQVKIDLLFTQFNQNKYANAIETAKEYLYLYPRTKRVDYVLYMKGLAGLYTDRPLLQDRVRLDASRRDITTIKEAFNDFKRIIDDYPQSHYYVNAVQHMQEIRHILAKHEVKIAEFYLSKYAYVAAIARADIALKKYDDPVENLRALDCIIKSYDALGLKSFANDARKVKKINKI